jgi:hypothetical protein
VDRKGWRHYIQTRRLYRDRQARRLPLSVAMAKAKKTKPRELPRWRVSLITKTPAKFIDFTRAPDAATAEKQIAEEYDIEETMRHRLVAIREDW